MYKGELKRNENGYFINVHNNSEGKIIKVILRENFNNTEYKRKNACIRQFYMLYPDGKLKVF